MATRTNTTNGSAHTGARTGRREAARAALDVMLTDASVSQGRVRRFLDPVSTAKLAAVLARRPWVVARRVGGLGAELGRIATGSSELAPAKGDRRFADRAWNESWMFRRLMQAYLALGGTVEALIDDADLDWQAESQARFTLSNVLDAARWPTLATVDLHDARYTTSPDMTGVSCAFPIEESCIALSIVSLGTRTKRQIRRVVDSR